jgi:hypothetical protein
VNWLRGNWLGNQMSKKALCKPKRTGDLFVNETDVKGNFLSTGGPLSTKDLNPKALDYGDYWDPDKIGRARRRFDPLPLFVRDCE